MKWSSEPLSLLGRLLVRLGFPIRVGSVTKPGWRGSLPVYVFWCKKHGYAENYSTGHGESLRCPECQIEEEFEMKAPIGKSVERVELRDAPERIS